MLLNKTVTIYVPTYRNEAVFEACLKSYLNQTYSNIKIKIFDNSCADGFQGIKNIINKYNDIRINYYENTTNVGAVGNYLSIFRSVLPTEIVIILAADMGLKSNAIEQMMNAMNLSGAGAVYPRTCNFPHKVVDANGLPIFAGLGETIPAVFEGDMTMPGFEALKHFFDKRFLNSELAPFSWTGALIDGKIIYGDYRTRLGYRLHGAEFLLSMQILLSCPKVAFLKCPYLTNFVGQERFGDQIRPHGYLSRYEGIAVSEQFIKENECALMRYGFNMNRLRLYLIQKNLYFIFNYHGFEAELLKGIINNILYIILFYIGKIIITPIYFLRLIYHKLGKLI